MYSKICTLFDDPFGKQIGINLLFHELSQGQRGLHVLAKTAKAYRTMLTSQSALRVFLFPATFACIVMGGGQKKPLTAGHPGVQ